MSAADNITVSPNASFGRSYAIFFSNVTTRNISQVGAGLKVTFEVNAASESYPNSAKIRIYNAAPTTVNAAVSKGYDTVTLQAGYGNQSAIIFQGTIVQFKFGKESNVDSYLELLAVDGYFFHNYAFMSMSVELPITQGQKVKYIADGSSIAIPLSQNSQTLIDATKPLTGDAAQTYGGILPRGVVQWGMSKQFLDETSSTVQGQWSIQNGILTFTPVSSYSPTTAIVVNSGTGMIGIPEATDGGINVTMLLNPLVRPGSILQISSYDIAQAQNVGSIAPNLLQGGYLPPVAQVSQGLGYYLVFGVNHRGDTRGEDWLTEAICLAIDPSNYSITPTPTWSAQ
jgi:hypothetical protein